MAEEDDEDLSALMADDASGVKHLDAQSREAYFNEEDKVQEALAAIRT